jgi:hypothetical protein
MIFITGGTMNKNENVVAEMEQEELRDIELDIQAEEEEFFQYL